MKIRETQIWKKSIFHCIITTQFGTQPYLICFSKTYFYDIDNITLKYNRNHNCSYNKHTSLK